MKLAIDIGSNTSKCLLAEKTSNGLEKLFELSIENRISAGDGRLVSNASQMIANAVQKFIAEAKNYCQDFQTIAVATSALREAPNGVDVALQASKQCATTIRILSGEAEAEFSFLGAMSDNAIPNTEKDAFFDLGGGSLEVVFGNKGKVEQAFSLPVGAVVLTKKFCASEKISEQTASEILSFLDFEFANVNFSTPEILVGVGGAVVAARLMNEKINAIKSNKISVDQIKEFIQILSSMSVQERSERFKIARNRADIIVPAFLCIVALAKRLSITEIFHTFHNLRYGLILNS